MSASDEVRTALIEMGVDPAKAHEASMRYHNAEAAINWVFGEGENWAPAPDPVPAGFDPYANAWTRPALGSNNPFRPPTPPPRPDRRDADTWWQLSEGKEESDRADRERSVRASAPPPSPSRATEDEEVVTFGPSNKNDPEGYTGKTAVTSAQLENNKEEADIQRAIQESMMMASFHSAASQQTVSIPPQQPKEAGAPTMFLAVEQPAYAAQILQALAAVPQLSYVLAQLKVESDDPEALVTLHKAFSSQANETQNYILADEFIQQLHQAWDVSSTTLPPHGAITEKWIPNVNHQLTEAASVRNNLVVVDDSLADFYSHPDRVLETRLHSVPMVPHTNVMFDRTLSSPNTLHDALGNLILSPEHSGESIEQLADVVFVCLRRMPGVVTSKWELDDEVFLDRYLTSNAKWAAEVRANQGVVEGELRRCREQIERLTSFREHNLPDAITTLIKHLDADSAPSDSRANLKDNLERISDLIKAKVTKLEEAIATHENEANGSLFNTTNPDKCQNDYLLRAILWHDGFLTPGRHLYAYVREGDGWWRVADEVTSVTWDEIQADTTGLFTDGGPYLLLYSRKGPRPPDTMDIDSDATATATEPPSAKTDVVDTPQPAAVPCRSRPPSPVKGSVKGPRPLVKKPSCSESIAEGKAGNHGPHQVSPISPVRGNEAKVGSIKAAPEAKPGTASEPAVVRKDIDNDLVMDQ